MSDIILGTFKFSDEKLPMMTVFNTKKVKGFGLRKDDSGIGEVAIDLLFTNFHDSVASVSIYTFPFQKLTKEKIALIGQSISDMAYDNVMNPFSKDDVYGVLIKPDDVKVIADPNGNAIDPMFVPIEKILALELLLPSNSLVLFIEADDDKRINMVTWQFPDQQACTEHFKLFLSKQITKLQIALE